MKKLIIGCILVLGVMVYALDFSNIKGVETENVKISSNHVAEVFFAYDKAGKKINIGYGKHYGFEMAQNLWRDANSLHTFWDMNSVEAVDYAAEQKAAAAADMVKYQEILDKF